MTEIQCRSDFTVKFLGGWGDDELVCNAARVSTEGSASVEGSEAFGLINYLTKHRHGSPFEHNSMTWLIEAPIFVFREFMRHRIGFSYNEESARYRDLAPVFYVPPAERGLIRTTTAARPEFAPGTESERNRVKAEHEYGYAEAWGAYSSMRQAGIASEVARSVLPVGIYSAAYVTCNARSLMAFLSLRTHHKDAAYVSYPQWEIAQVAEAMEAVFMERFPLTWRAFQNNGRVAP